MIHYSSEMKEQDSLWEIEKEDLEKMKVLFENIMIEAKSLGFNGTWVIYDGNSESIIDIFEDEKHEEECNLGTEEPLGSFGYSHQNQILSVSHMVLGRKVIFTFSPAVIRNIWDNLVTV